MRLEKGTLQLLIDLAKVRFKLKDDSFMGAKQTILS